ncbi:MAG: hypothetical protein ACWGSQ_06360 [Longimicrobiales bacterium]
MKIRACLLGVLVGLMPSVPLSGQEIPPEANLSPHFYPLRIDSRLLTPSYPTSGRPSYWQQVQSQWERLAEVGTGRQAVVSLSDGTLKGGRIVEVLPNALRMESAGQAFEIPRPDMVTVRVQRKSYTMAGGVVGFLVSGLGWMAYACHDDDCGVAGALLVFTLLGAPGGLVGALIGSQAGGDVEFIF